MLLLNHYCEVFFILASYPPPTTLLGLGEGEVSSACKAHCRWPAPWALYALQPFHISNHHVGSCRLLVTNRSTHVCILSLSIRSFLDLVFFLLPRSSLYLSLPLSASLYCCVIVRFLVHPYSVSYACNFFLFAGWSSQYIEMANSRSRSLSLHPSQLFRYHCLGFNKIVSSPPRSVSYHTTAYFIMSLVQWPDYGEILSRTRREEHTYPENVEVAPPNLAAPV